MGAALDHDKIFDFLKEHNRDLRKYAVKRIGLFGSYVWKRVNGFSI